MFSKINFRRTAFFAFDYLRGNPTAFHLDDLNRYFQKPAENEQLTGNRLQKLLNHACKTTRYYRQFSGVKQLRDLPVIEKSLIKQRYEDFISDAYDRGSLLTATTSGSYGTPMNYLFTKDKHTRLKAEIIFFNRWANYEVGMKHVYIRARPKNAFKLFLQNEILIIPLSLSESWLEQQRQILLKRNMHFLIGYPSIISALARWSQYKGDNPSHFSLKGIISTAEPLYEYNRQIIQETFGCISLNRYSAEELGVLGHECPAKTMHLNLSSFFIELLEPGSNRPVAPGETGRVVVTDLFSYAMPLIRYDTGDLAVLGKDECNCGLNTPTLERIEGRMVEIIYNTSRERVPPLVLIPVIAGTLNGIVQFQFIQRSEDDYVIKYCITPIFPKDKVHLVIEGLREILGRNAEIQIEYVTSIPPLPSGKRPYIINEYQTMPDRDS